MNDTEQILARIYLKVGDYYLDSRGKLSTLPTEWQIIGENKILLSSKDKHPVMKNVDIHWDTCSNRCILVQPGRSPLYAVCLGELALGEKCYLPIIRGGTKRERNEHDLWVEDAEPCLILK
jgi:hypothetical protein